MGDMIDDTRPEGLMGTRRDVDGGLSALLYVASVPLAFVHAAIFILAALTWLLPDRRSERVACTGRWSR